MAYLNAVVDTLQQNSYYQAQIDWRALRQQVLTRVQGGAERTNAILLALQLLEDNHSYYAPPFSNTILMPSSSPRCTNASPQLPFDWPSDIGVIVVGRFLGNAAAASAFATEVQGIIRSQDRPGMAGWVVDLRNNTGGDASAMISGIGPVLGEGLAGYYVRGDGSTIPWGYESGGMWQGTRSNRTVLVQNPYQLSVPARRVAVLTDGLTASAGEAIAVAFRGRSDTRSFGSQTCGRSSTISIHALNDGGVLGIMYAIDADRLGDRYGGVLVPARVVGWLRQ